MLEDSNLLLPDERGTQGRGCARVRCVARAVVRTWDEDRVDRVDEAVVALNVRRPAGRFGGAFRLQANDGIVQPVLAELAVRGEGATLDRFLVGGESIERDFARDDVVLEDVPRDRGADFLLVLVEGRIGRREERVLAIPM